ncbi:DUF6701 domain-containing protein [Vibrio scophthalmi]|uniref:DUF6701 domain-containing protein n=1 Tax=Vibrio scophthalmi LMG 19158 TaxID=870967 RepID=F9RJ86_9VIBR|nr:DUF6701 domain-containing protein [Vibrio scophthalmi]EGU41014.1 hypothetical protein VIS19158_04186 [Vibrio scophthalmi LMG 19158]
MKMVFLLVLSLFSTAVLADDDVIEYCQVNVKESFSIYVNYGNVSDSQRVMQRKKPSTDDRFDDDVLYLTDKFNSSEIKLWSNDEEDAIFYDASIDDDDGVALRFDFVVTGHSGNNYIGDMTYYIERTGAWEKQRTESLTLSYTAHRARALHLREIDDDDDDDLNGLRCSSGEPPVVNPPEFKLDICPYVPNVVQTNNVHFGSPNGSLVFSPTFQGLENKVLLPAKNSKFFFSSTTIGVKYCQAPDGDLVSCAITSTLPIDNYPPNIGTMPDSMDRYPAINCRNNHTCSDVDAGRYKEIKVANGQTLTLTGGSYEVSYIELAEDAKLLVSSDTQIKYAKIAFTGHRININHDPDDNSYDDRSSKLLFIGIGENSEFRLRYVPPSGPRVNVSDSIIHAHIYVDPSSVNRTNGFAFTGRNNIVLGGVSANTVDLAGELNTIGRGDLDCYTPSTPKIARINIVPNNMYLQCQGDKSVYVEVFDRDDNPITDIGSARVSLYSAELNALGFTLTGFDTVNGRFEYQISSKAGNDYGPIPVKAHAVGDSSVNDDSDIVFAPVKFNINDGKEKELIAGKSTNITMSVLACSEDDQTITGNYSKKLTEDNLNNSSFIPNQWVDNSKHLSLEADFTNGITLANLKFDEAGQYVGQLTDTIRCDDFGKDVKDCPTGQTQAITGELKFKARPWTFALCRADMAPLPNGDISNPSSAGFVAAGDNFAINALPIRWQSGGALSGSIATNDAYCNSSLITKNFAKGGAGNIQISLTHSLNLPSGGETGVLAGTTTTSYTSALNGYYPFNDLKWSEVGQIKLNVVSDQYLGMAIQSGEKDLGRFYPKYFRTVGTPEWNYPGTPSLDEQSFIYMNQPFEGVSFQVEALNAMGNAVQNYASFEASVTAGFDLFEPAFLDRFNSLPLTKSWYLDASRSIGTFSVNNASPSSVCEDELCWEKAPTTTGYEDGPFNKSGGITTDISITESSISNPDPVEYQSVSTLVPDPRRLSVQPDIRFGRVVLNSVGGVVNNEGIAIPLRVEFWNGSRFITNTDDSQADIKGSNLVSNNQILWTDENDVNKNTEVNLSLGGVVNEGASRSIIAKQVHLVRQQTQAWLELDDSINKLPWFQYHWDTTSSDESNPSTVVTFGIFRGNDKIIFRGESGLIGL